MTCGLRCCSCLRPNVAVSAMSSCISTEMKPPIWSRHAGSRLPRRYRCFALVAAFAPNGTKADEISLIEKSLPGEGQRPQAIVVGPDGNLWVTEVIKHQIFRVTPNGEMSSFRVPGDQVGVIQGITSGPDGNLWFTSREENAIRRISTKGEFNGTFAIPSQATTPTKFNTGSWPRGITVGPDGQIWFAEMAANKIGRVTLTGEFSEFCNPDGKCRSLWCGDRPRSEFVVHGKRGRKDRTTRRQDRKDHGISARQSEVAPARHHGRAGWSSLVFHEWL